MKKKYTAHLLMRLAHRYLGFFLAGIMAVYALSGVVLIYRDTDVFKRNIKIEKTIDKNIEAEFLGEKLKLKRLNVEKSKGDTLFFKNGFYTKTNGKAVYSVQEMPLILDKMCHLHKAQKADSLYYLNIFFGISLFFFVVSSFWMFLPKTSIFKMGLYFTAAGILLTIIMLLL